MDRNRDHALCLHLTDKVMGYAPGAVQWLPGKGRYFDPLTSADDTLQLIEKLDRDMAINREDSPDGPWCVCFFGERGSNRVDAEANGDTLMRAACEAAGKLTGFEG